MQLDKMLDENTLSYMGKTGQRTLFERSLYRYNPYKLAKILRNYKSYRWVKDFLWENTQEIIQTIMDYYREYWSYFPRGSDIEKQLNFHHLYIEYEYDENCDYYPYKWNTYNQKHPYKVFWWIYPWNK